MKNKSKINYKNLLSQLQKLHLSKINLIEKILSNSYNLLLENLYSISLGIYACVDGVKILALDKNVISGYILLRTIFESWVNIRYISMDNTHKRAAAFTLSDIVYKKKLTKDIMEYFDSSYKFIKNTKFNSIEKCRKSIIDIEKENEVTNNSLENDYKIDLTNLKPWNNNTKDKAKSVNLISDYIIIFTILSKYTHLNSTALKTIFNLKSDKPKIEIKKSSKESNLLLGAVFSYYFNSLKDLFKNFDIYKETEFKPLENLYHVIEKKYYSSTL